MTDTTPITLISKALTVRILRRGAILQDVRLVGDDLSLVLGAPNVSDYADAPMSHFGAVMGPVANRIATASGEIDGISVRMEASENHQNALHSGSVGLHLKDWWIETHTADAVTLRVDCPDMEGGLPGNRHAR